MEIRQIKVEKAAFLLSIQNFVLENKIKYHQVLSLMVLCKIVVQIFLFFHHHKVLYIYQSLKIIKSLRPMTLSHY